MNRPTQRYHLVFLVLFLAQSWCLAQVDRAGLSGTVTDSSGKRIPGARVSAMQAATGLVRETVSSSKGVYDIPELPIGFYRVICTATGFQQSVGDSLELTVGHTQTLDFTLAVGEVTQQVNVSRRSSQLDETTDTLGARTDANK